MDARALLQDLGLVGISPMGFWKIFSMIYLGEGALHVIGARWGGGDMLVGWIATCF
jgi:hypothetical protein